MEMKSRIQEKFKTLYGTDGEMFASAGRVNLIGEHTDYNGGYVFPGAIQYYGPPEVCDITTRTLALEKAE